MVGLEIDCLNLPIIGMFGGEFRQLTVGCSELRLLKKLKTLYSQKLSKLFLVAKILILVVIFSIIILFRQSRWAKKQYSSFE